MRLEEEIVRHRLDVLETSLAENRAEIVSLRETQEATIKAVEALKRLVDFDAKQAGGS